MHKIAPMAYQNACSQESEHLTPTQHNMDTTYSRQSKRCLQPSV